MTQPTLPAAEHRHVGGSAGGPGENSADCVCGVTFDGFDTHREAMKVLEQHIKDETKAKPVALLEAADWIDLTSLNHDTFEGGAVVRYVETFKEIGYREPYTMVVFGGVGEDRPWSHSWPATTKVRLLTEAEIEKIKEDERREQMARQFEQLADMVRGGKVPFPRHDQIIFDLKTRAEVRAVGEALGLVPSDRWGDGLQVSWPKGRQSYDDGLFVLWNTSEKPPVEPVEDERCEHCGESLREIRSGTLGHIPGEACAPVDGTPPCYVANGFQAPEVIAEREADCAARHPGQVCLLPSGLTRAADQSRGPLAGTTPVVTYFSFGYGQTDPDSGQKLIDHYVTVVAPTYEECRTAMFASRYGNKWSWDYLAGRPKTTAAVSQWTEHEVIVADGTDQELAKSALKAADDLLYGFPGAEVDL